MTTSAQDKEFIAELIPALLLELAIDWITGTFSPEDIYEDSVLEKWAEENGYEKKEQE